MVIDAAVPVKAKEKSACSLEAAAEDERKAVLQLLGDDSLGDQAVSSVNNVNGTLGKIEKDKKILPKISPVPQECNTNSKGDNATLPTPKIELVEHQGSGTGSLRPPVSPSLTREFRSTSESEKSSPNLSQYSTSDRQNMPTQQTGSRRQSSPIAVANRPVPLLQPVPHRRSFDKAYRRLSNAAVAWVTGQFGGNDQNSAAISPLLYDGPISKDSDTNTAVESSSSSSSSSDSEEDEDEDEDANEKRTGDEAGNDDGEDEEEDRVFSEESGGEKRHKKLENAAEVERLEVTHKMPQTVVGVFPSMGQSKSRRNQAISWASKVIISDSTPAGLKKKHVHPNTNFRIKSSGSRFNVSSDIEQSEDAVKKAAAMKIVQTPIEHFGLRTTRTLTRGNFEKAEEEAKRVRTYLCACDSSLESVYALEWGIGTVLRSGDTMYVVHAIERTQDMTDEMLLQSNRDIAVKEMTHPIVRFLKRTRLQVQIITEVIHHRIPRHLLIEMIDYLEPSLVILGSRGRTALKSVLLGSFSNYILSKSSAPVMVSRRKLRKGKHRERKEVRMVRMANNLLAEAKID